MSDWLILHIVYYEKRGYNQGEQKLQWVDFTLAASSLYGYFTVPVSAAVFCNHFQIYTFITISYLILNIKLYPLPQGIAKGLLDNM